jgi:hypothetical protein
MCRGPVSLFSARSLAEPCAALRTPDTPTVFGQAYLQGGMPGLAAYHFDSEDDCYVSYAAAPPQWRLDDGSAPPAKKPFTATSYDADRRIFRGTVSWEVPFGGSSKWVYEMHFSEDFNIICDGTLRSYTADGAAEPVQKFGEDLIYWRDRPNPTTVAGCVFIQGDTHGLASYHFDEDLASPYISYENAPPTWALSDGTPFPRRKPFLAPVYDAETRTFRGEVVWDPPTDGQAKWVYRMVFSETFGAIEGGEVEMIGPDGARLDTRFFGQDLFYRRMVHEREQMKAFIEYRVRRSRVSDASDDGT